MLMLEYVKWWYGTGWVDESRRILGRFQVLGGIFSVSILVRTLFSPWKRIITYPGAGLDAHLRAFVDNLVSRAVGFLVRVCVLISAAILLIIMTIVSLVEIIVWPLLPIGGLALIVWGLLP